MPVAPLSVCHAVPVQRFTTMLPCEAASSGYATYVTTGRPSLPTAVETSKTAFGAAIWLTPFPVAEPPSDCQKGLTPASAIVAVDRTTRASSQRRTLERGFTARQPSKSRAGPGGHRN